MREENRLDKDTQQDTAQLLQMAKEKLRWFTLEASEEEFDENAVDALVNLIAAMEQKNETSVDEQKELEYFHAYCEFYEQEEAKRRGSANSEEDSIKSEGKKLRFKEKAKKFPKGRRLGFAAAAAGILLMIAVGGTGAVKAGEDGGFFVWLRKDGEGKFFVTSTKETIDVEEGTTKVYSRFEDIPKEYQEYVIKEEDIGLLNNFKLQNWERTYSILEEQICAIFNSNDDKEEIVIGVCFYEDKVLMAEKYDEYKYLNTNNEEDYNKEIFAKRNDTGAEEYIICFYKEDIKYYVMGNGELSFLEKIAEEYMKYVCDK